LPLSVAERDFDLALREWRSVVGPANVVDSSPGLDGYRDAYSPLEDNAPQASAAVLPNSVEQVQESCASPAGMACPSGRFRPAGTLPMAVPPRA